MKKILNLILLLSLLMSQTCAYAASGHSTNTLRTMFQNNEAIIYAINIRTFNANDKNGDEIIDKSAGEESGTFLNAIARLDELSNFGVNTVHILPITPVGKVKAMGTAGSLYAISDFTTINPQLADNNSKLPLEQQARLFVDECHKKNIKVIIDLPSCGSYDLYIKQPELFALDKKQQPVIPCDWTDVRVFKTTNADGTLNEELYDQHRKFVDMVMGLGADGIRADVATIKPYEFWAKLIKYTRDKDPEFLFLAEASDSWTTPPSEYTPFTDYKKLLDAGFDGFYGSYFNFKTWKSPSELKKQVDLSQNLSKNYKTKKSVIGSFATHDELSPIITGKAKFSEMIMWLNATLPLNPYYVDGFMTGDTYLYSYANRKAKTTNTDDDYYYVHKGKLDIFNFSRRPGGNNADLLGIFFLSTKFREYAEDMITKGSFKLLPTNNSNIFAYTRSYNDKSIAVIINKNLEAKTDITIKVRGLTTKSNVMPVKFNHTPEIKDGKIILKMEPGDTTVLYFNDLKI